jgi:hypothetical protein
MLTYYLHFNLSILEEEVTMGQLPNLTLKSLSQSSGEKSLGDKHFRMTITYKTMGMRQQRSYDEPLFPHQSPAKNTGKKINLINKVGRYILENEPFSKKIYRVQNITLEFWECDRERVLEVANALITEDEDHPKVCQSYDEVKPDSSPEARKPWEIPVEASQETTAQNGLTCFCWPFSFRNNRVHPPAADESISIDPSERKPNNFAA